MGFPLLGRFLIWCLFFRFSFSQQPNTDKYLVYDFFMRIGSTKNSSASQSFSSDVCLWKNVFCDSQNKNVIRLLFSGMNISGSIPDNTIGKLRNLQLLDLSDNKIIGFSSDFWGLGSNLRILNLSFNQISGFLPNDIGNFGSMNVLDISSNNFSGKLPESLSSLQNLKVLKVGDNQFEGNVPPGILKCKSLVTLDLSLNRFNGSLPDGFGVALVELRELNLAVNEIHGRSSDFSGLKSLTSLNISRNLYWGPISSFCHKKLQVLDLSRNKFQGHVRFQYNSSSMLPNLIYLDISANRLSGKFIDRPISQPLKHLNLANNRFLNPKLPNIETFLNLEYLNLSLTGLRGTLPTKISKLTALRVLDLSQNHLHGYIPSLNPKKLQILDLSWNNFAGSLSPSLLSELPKMQKFNFSYNNLTLCAAKFSPEIWNKAFLGTHNNCPIAVNPSFFTTNERTKKRGNGVIVLGLALSVIFFLSAFSFAIFIYRKKKQIWKSKALYQRDETRMSGTLIFQTDSTNWIANVKLAASVPVIIFDKPLLKSNFSDLLTATSYFNQKNMILEGKFGPVYRGYLPDGTCISVKILVRPSSLSDHHIMKEFEYLGHIKHENLVPLVGYCLLSDKIIVIYDYMEDKNLHNVLHVGLNLETCEENDNGFRRIDLEILSSWRFRHKIALGIARALAFLHHGCSPQIIHSDVKSSNVYLDSKMEPRLSDFGLDRIVGCNKDSEICQHSSEYSPPDFCAENFDPMVKSDVFAFGVVLFELITGKKTLEDTSNLVNYVRKMIKSNLLSDLIDPRIQESGLEAQIEEGLKIAYLCTADLPMKRPSMHQIVGLLKDIKPERE